MTEPSNTPPFTDIYPSMPDPPAETHNDRTTPPETEAQPDAPASSAIGSTARTTSQTTPRDTPRRIPIPWITSGMARLGKTAVPRGTNASLVLALVRHRVLSYHQIARLFFPGRTIQAVGRRVSRLGIAGWVSTWDRPVVAGGQPRFVVPSARAQRWAFRELLAQTRETVLGPLVHTMLPARPRSPLVLKHGITPPFFQHQKETNDLAIALARATGLPVLWSSSWERPLPVQADGIALPQPDAVFVVGDAGRARLVFLEHDRGMEPVAHFRRTKTAAYADLARRRELCQRLFGFPTFEVWISVLDARDQRPLRRVAALVSTAIAEQTTAFMRFTLGGWLNAFPDGPVFFPRGVRPELDEVKSTRHALEPITAGWGEKPAYPDT